MLRQIGMQNFADVYRIMQASFPEDEYRPYEEQLALLQEPEYRIYALIAEGQEAVTGPDVEKADSGTEKRLLTGFLAVWEFDLFVFIEHFAVDASLRGNGTGSAMLQKLVERYQKPICLEVELPETELACRRIGFYERNGFVLNKHPYMQPPISEGKAPVPLWIMTYKDQITQEEFRKMKGILYEHVYKTIEEIE